MKICWKCAYCQAIQDVDEFEFVSLLEQIWRNVSLHHLLTKGSSAVNGCRQNESPNSWESKQHHNNPQHSRPSINILWSPKLRVCKKQINH